MTPQERQAMALANKLELRMLAALMKNAVRDNDRKKLLDAFESKLQENEAEFKAVNDLIKNTGDKRVTIKNELSTLTKRAEQVSEFVYTTTGEGSNIKYFKTKTPSPRDILFTDQNNKPVKKSLTPNKYESKGDTSGLPLASVRFSFDDIYIPISKDVYDAAVFERTELKDLIKDKQAEYNRVTEQHTELLDRYVSVKGSVAGTDKKGRFDQTKLADMKMKVDILKEQLANDNIFLNQYINNKDQFSGVEYNEESGVFMPVDFDKWMTVQAAEGEITGYQPPAFRFDQQQLDSLLQEKQLTKAQQKQREFSRAKEALQGTVDEFRARPMTIKPRAWWAVNNDETKADYTSKYLRIFGGKKKNQNTDSDGTPVQRMVDPGVKNPNFQSDFSRDMNRQMQEAIKPMTQRKNQNMNPGGFNMKNYLDK